jgi:hypothetical protein
VVRVVEVVIGAAVWVARLMCIDVLRIKMHDGAPLDVGKYSTCTRASRCR